MHSVAGKPDATKKIMNIYDGGKENNEGVKQWCGHQDGTYLAKFLVEKGDGVLNSSRDALACEVGRVAN